MSDDSLSALIDLVVSDAELATGRNADWMIAQGANPIRPTQRSEPPAKPSFWTAEEDDFLFKNRPYMTVQEIARALGRSDNAVRVRAVRVGAPAPRHTPGYISGNQIAELLNVDAHKPPCWIDLGILEGELFPYEGRVNRRVRVAAFKRWLIRPTSWVYFDVKNIKNGAIRRLVELAQTRWDDEWITMRQAADLMKRNTEDIRRQIRLGKLYGYHAIGMDRKRVFGWVYWYVRRSDIENLVIPLGQGNVKKNWSDRADAFLLRARDELHLEFTVIAPMMKWHTKQVYYRYQRLKEERNGGTRK